MRKLTLALVTGICTVHSLPVLPATSTIAVLAAFVALGSCFLRVFRVFAAGIVLATLTAAAVLADRWPVARHGEDVRVQGTVASLPDGVAHGRFMFHPDPGQDSDLPRQIRVNWFLDTPMPLAGERWVMTLRMRSPRGALNPSAFDYEQWLTVRRIGATATVREHPAPYLQGDGSFKPVLSQRKSLDTILASALGNHPRRPLIRGLVLGERGEVSAHEWEVFARTGTAHLMAISGMHIGMVATLIFGVVVTVARTISHFAPYSRTIAVIVALAVAAVYAALAGFAIPARRALVMLAVVAILLCLRRQSVWLSAWMFALFFILLTDPLAPLAIGFWLSFGAVGILTWSMGSRRAVGGPVVGLVRAQWTVALGLLPLTLWFFQRGSLIAPIVNLIAVPAFTFVIVPGALLGTAMAMVFPDLGRMLLHAVAWILDLAWSGLELSAGWPGSMRFHPQPALPVVLSALLGAVVMLAPRGVPLKVPAGLILMVPLVTWMPPGPTEGGWRMTVLEVGQGLATVVQTSRHVLVYDTGPSNGTGLDAGARHVVPFLRALGVRALDMVVISHPHDDHYGGLESVLSAFPDTPVLAGDAGALAGNATPCRRGQSWQWDGVDFRILHPTEDVNRPANLISCVLEIRSASGSGLLTGDIEWPVELELSMPGSALQPVDVLIVPHHGSATSSIPRFVARTRPVWAIVPAGFANRWGFPDAAVLRRLDAVGSQVYVVGDSGAVTVNVDSERGVIDVHTERQRQRRWWRTLLSSIEQGNG